MTLETAVLLVFVGLGLAGIIARHIAVSRRKTTAAADTASTEGGDGRPPDR